MGVVYLAEQPGLRRKVALKVIVPDLAGDEAFKARFQDEAQHAASVDHPNVVPVFEAGEADGHVYLAMRFVSGVDLRTLLTQRGRLDRHEAAAIIPQVGAALDAAHAHGLIHRDVKPANILLAGVDAGSHVYLSDFGLTKELSSQSGPTHTGQWVGTIDYVAPEQVAGGRVDARADIYSLGCVLFHVLAGRLPYEGNDVQKMYAHVNRPLPSLSEVDDRLGAAFDPVIQRATAKEPEDRYASAGDLGRAARLAASGQALTAPEHSVATGIAAPARGAETVASPRNAETVADPRTATTQALPPDPPHRSSPRLLAAILGLAGLAVGLVVAVFVLMTQDEAPQPVTTTATSEAAVTATSEDDGTVGGPESSGDKSGSPQFESYVPEHPDSSYSYSAQIPGGAEWSLPAETELTPGRLLRTTVRGPDGLVLIIDRTPFDVPDLGGEFDSQRSVPQPAFGEATEYVISSSDRIPECSGNPCVDYLIEDGSGGGWGVLAGGTDLSLVRQIGSEVASSISPGA